jgi:hypothetical protein
MVPWPIALLTLFYGVIATISAATVWKIVTGVSGQSLIWPVAWLALSGSAMCGLPLLKPWARGLAVFGSALLALVSLAFAGLLVMAGQPLGGLLATLGAAIHVLVIRYLQRPVVKAYFRQGTAVSTQHTARSPQ